MVLIERLSITFPLKSGRNFIPRGQVSPLFVVYVLFIICSHKLVVSTNFFVHKNCFELFLSDHFLFFEILNLNLTFDVCRIRAALTR